MRRPVVLVAEDEPGVRGPLEKFLGLYGFEVRSAGTADGAIDQLARGPVDAAVVDIRLGDGSGRDVVLWIPPPTPVIIFSAVPDETLHLEHIRPNTRLILKPFSLLMLVETLQRMMAAAARREPGTRRAAAIL